MFDKVNFKPYPGRVLVQKEQGKLLQGYIVAVGEDKLPHVPVPFTIGDHVLFGDYSGTLVSIENKVYLIMQATDVFGTLTKP